MPAAWQLDPPRSGPLQGANFIVVLVDRVFDDDANGQPRSRGTNPLILIVAPGRQPETGRTASVILGGFASNPASVPGFYRVNRASAVRVEQTIKSQDPDAEEVTDVWEAHEGLGHALLEVRLRSVRQLSTRTRDRGETYAVSTKDPALWQRHTFDAAVDVVKSVPQGIDQLREYTFRLTVPEYRQLFDGSEQLVGIAAASWHMRRVFVP